jgi:asparagine synthase (glutamine-hydrolysing)
MCGIAGTAGTSAVAFDGEKAIEALSRRGPDGSGVKQAGSDSWNWELVHTRLSIVDLSDAGLQPIANETGELWLVFNGEIYNYPELRQLCEGRGHTFSSNMDGEVILHLWEMEGPECLARLNGIFAIALADTTSGDVFLARDPVGVKPLFYSGDGERIWWGSEIRALAEMGAPLGSHDKVALAQFLSFLWIPDPRTPFERVRSLKPREILKWSRGIRTSLTYGTPLFPDPDPSIREPADALSQLTTVFSEGATRQLMADVPIGLMASGGVDSSLIWWATGQGVARGFSIEWENSASERLDEDAEAVRQLQEQLGTPVAFLSGDDAERQPLPPSGDLFADPAYELTRLIARTARSEGYKVLLSGQGGDELFAGYRRHVLAPWINRLRFGPVSRVVHKALLHMPTDQVKVEYLARLALATGQRSPFEGYMQLCTYSTAEDRAAALGCYEHEVTDEVVWSRHREVFDSLPPGLSFLRKAMTVDLNVYLPGLGLAYVDRAGMEFGVEIRVPWLDLEVIRWSLRLPDEFLMRKGQPKWLTKELTAQALSRSIAYRAKRGFASPTNRVKTANSSAGNRGFRQGAYFGRAQEILNHYLARGSGSRTAA